MPRIALKRLQKEETQSRAKVWVHLLVERHEEATFTVVNTSESTLQKEMSPGRDMSRESHILGLWRFGWISGNFLKERMVAAMSKE